MADDKALDKARDLIRREHPDLDEAELEKALERGVELQKEPPKNATASVLAETESDDDDWKECVRIAGETLQKHLETAKTAEPAWNRIAQTIAAYAIWFVTVNAC
jgi:predicted Zn-dependent protease